MSTRMGYSLSHTGYQPLRRNVTDSEIKLLKKVFEDSKSGSCLNRQDLKVAFIYLFGYKPSKLECIDLVNKHGVCVDEESKEKVLTESQFIVAMTPYMVRRDEDEDIRYTFLAFDTQCKGFLTVEDFKKVVNQVAPHMTSSVVESTFRELDRDGDKRISYKDFDFMMKYGTED